jgi:hypothetical protein
MNNIGQYKPGSEPDRKLVERAILRVLEIAEHQGISASDLVVMLESGMQITDFLAASKAFTAVTTTPSTNDDTLN